MKHTFILLALISIISASTLVINGDFEQDLATGWQQDITHAAAVVNRLTNLDPDPDYEVQVYQGLGSGYAKLYQVVDIPVTDLEFSVDARFFADDTDPSAWTAASVILSYYNASGTLLGDTRICAISPQCPWVSTATIHIIAAPDTSWHNYTFNIDQELTNLPGINPADIKKISAALFDTTYHC